MGRGETNAKKRKRQETTKINTTKPSALFKPTQKRDWTLSVAVPGSIVGNAQSHELRTALAGCLARAFSVFCVDEVVVFDDGHSNSTATTHQRRLSASDTVSHDYTGTSDPDHFLVHLLSYLETPPNLRRHLFPLHPNLRTAGTLPSLDLPHHLKPNEWCIYREGVTLPAKDRRGTLVEAGLRVPVTVEAQIPAKTRVTLRFNEKTQIAATDDDNVAEINAEPVAPEEPREESGYYWGYKVRKAASLSAVFTECTYKNGYDTSIGTSERGMSVEDIPLGTLVQPIGGFKHLIIVFGGVAGLEVAVQNDDELQMLGVVEAKDIFDWWVNVCPGQGSRTIRTEEAVWIGLMALRRFVMDANK